MASEASDKPSMIEPKRLRRVGIRAIVVAVAIAVIGIAVRFVHQLELKKWTGEQAIPTVVVITPQPGTANQELVLPGDVQAYYEAPIYARVSGYVKMWYEDIGAHVKANQLLAEIDTPDLDQQLAQAKADLGTANATAELADLTAKRWQALLASDSVSQQAADEKSGDAAARNAGVAAAEANVQRLLALENFKRITAPFDGVVITRKTDIGALINAGSSSGAELFSVADIHKMRIYVRVPQAFVAVLRPGIKAKLQLPQFPDRQFDATLTTTSNAVAQESRTTLIELMADNADGKLWPGTYADVHLQLPSNPGVLHIPTSALIFREHGLEVATVGENNKVVLKPIEVGRDLGTEVEVSSGILASDTIIDSPSDSIEKGDAVKVAQSTTKEQTTASRNPPGDRK